MTIGTGETYQWVLGTQQDAQSKCARSLTKVYLGTPRDTEGSRKDNAVGVPVGGVVWPVTDGSHDDACFVTSAACLALFEPTANEVYLLDDAGAPYPLPGGFVPHPGAKPLKVGVNVKLAANYTRTTIGIVVRSAEFGSAGLDKNLFIGTQTQLGGGGQALVAHHLNPNPNVNSTPVYDPQEGSGVLPAIGPPGTQGQQIRKAFLDDQFVVAGYNKKSRAWAAECPGQTSATPSYPPPDPKGEWAVMWNCSASGVSPDRGYGMAYFTGQPAQMAHGASGPFRAASKKHGIADTVDGIMRSGAIDLNAYFTNGAEHRDAPLDFEPLEEPDVQPDVGQPVRVHLQYDSGECHYHILGPRSGKWRWHVKVRTFGTPACTPLKPGEDPVQYQFDMGGDMPSPTYHLGYMMGVGSIGLPPPNVHLLAR